MARFCTHIIVFISIVTCVITLLNMRYMVSIQNKHNNKGVVVPSTHVPVINHSIYSTRNETIYKNCSSEYQLDQNKVMEFYKIDQKSNLEDSKSLPKERILILTPISNAGRHLSNYFQMLCSLDYPHELISIALGEDTSNDQSFNVANFYAEKLRGYFNKIKVYHLSEKLNGHPLHDRHDKTWQLKRRTHMARSRNQLLSKALGDEDKVLWLDVDVKFIPSRLIQHLMSANADVVAASCMYISNGAIRNYDLNSWQETPQSIEYLKSKNPSFLMLEGYEKTKRRILPEITDQGNVVDLDGVGGCALLVNADCHRKGLNFPAFILDNHIETEGLGKLAKKMGFSVKGLPFVKVIHS